MRIGSWAGLMAAATLLAGCGDFWQAPISGATSFTLTASPTSLAVTTAATGTDTITVTPGSSFTGTVSLTCAVTLRPTGDTSSTDPTCSLSPTSLTFSTTSSQPSTLTATAGSTSGAYQMTVTGVSGSVAATATFCVAVNTPTSNCTATNSGNFYVVGTNGIYGYSIASSTLTALSGSPASLPVGATPYSMAIQPNGNHLYVGTSIGIYLYDIGTGGALSLDSSLPIPDDTSNALQVDSTGQWLLDASNTLSGPILYAWPINKTTGQPVAIPNGATVPGVSLIAGGNVAVGGLAISPDNNLVAVAVGKDTEIYKFTAGSGYTSSSAPISTPGQAVTAKSGATAISVAFNPGTNFLYIGETNDFTAGGGIHIIPISSDVVGNEPSTSPYPSGGDGPHAILADSNGYVYVANGKGTADGVIAAFLLDSTNSTLAVQSNTVSTGAAPYGMVLDSTGDFVLTANNLSDPTINAFTLSSGELTVSTSGSVVSGPVAIVAVP
ncbi:MAG: beta-propeller fold lactonase family protein [Terracidiphilus sp.]